MSDSPPLAEPPKRAVKYFLIVARLALALGVCGIFALVLYDTLPLYLAIPFHTLVSFRYLVLLVPGGDGHANDAVAESIIIIAVLLPCHFGIRWARNATEELRRQNEMKTPSSEESEQGTLKTPG
ncbi:MAG: hypothetical protein HQ581_24940 [Planctomycetes bacterium]|nr:hypothetical protein [Planctomycetota bacterium]